MVGLNQNIFLKSHGNKRDVADAATLGELLVMQVGDITTSKVLVL